MIPIHEDGFRLAVVTCLQVSAFEDGPHGKAFQTNPIDVGKASAFLTNYDVNRTLSLREEFLPMRYRGNGKPKAPASVRLKPFLKVLTRYQNTPQKEAIQAVGRAVEALRRSYKKKPLSAVTKCFWMMNPGIVPLFDSFAAEGLFRLTEKRFPSSRYEAYCTHWYEQYQRLEHQERISAQIAWLPKSSYFGRVVSHAGIKKDAIEAWLDKEWFRLRVFDLALHVRAGRYVDRTGELAASFFDSSEMNVTRFLKDIDPS